MLATAGTGRWIKRRGATIEGIARVDDAAVVTPPTGMEYGFVPITLYEGAEKPPGCQEIPPPSPPSPPPPPPLSPNCPSVPRPATCNARCLAAGHCCLGPVSNDGRPSCQQGCIVANFTATAQECMAVCRLNAKNCTWSVGGVHMTSCAANCPADCSSITGPFECEAGCTFAFEEAVRHEVDE